MVIYRLIIIVSWIASSLSHALSCLSFPHNSLSILVLIAFLACLVTPMLIEVQLLMPMQFTIPVRSSFMYLTPRTLSALHMYNIIVFSSHILFVESISCSISRTCCSRMIISFTKLILQLRKTGWFLRLHSRLIVPSLSYGPSPKNLYKNYGTVIW